MLHSDTPSDLNMDGLRISDTTSEEEPKADREADISGKNDSPSCDGSDVYGYGADAAEEAVDYGYGDGSPDEPVDYGYGDDSDVSYSDSDDDDSESGGGMAAYGYGGTSKAPPQPEKHRVVRRNSCLIRKNGNSLAVAEFLMGVPPLMSDKDLEYTTTCGARTA